MTFRTITPRDLLRKATSPETRDRLADGTRAARTHGARLAASKSVRLTAGVAAVATIGTVAATASAGAATTGPADAAHAPAASATHTAPQAPSSGSQSGPTTIYDSISPGQIPAGQHVATYSDGPYQASNSSVQGRGNVLWIDTNGTNPHANALDVEPGDATPAGAAHWVNAKLTANPHGDAIVYTFKSDWNAVQAQVNNLPTWEQAHVKYWIADPTGTPHIVPGAAATQWYWGSNYDITQATPTFFH